MTLTIPATTRMCCRSSDDAKAVARAQVFTIGRARKFLGICGWKNIAAVTQRGDYFCGIHIPNTTEIWEYLHT